MKLDELKALLAKATPGPAELSGGCKGWTLISNGVRIHGQSFGEGLRDLDADFYIAAVNSLPSLIARIEEYEEFLYELDLKPYPDSDPNSLLGWCRTRVHSLLEKWAGK